MGLKPESQLTEQENNASGANTGQTGNEETPMEVSPGDDESDDEDDVDAIGRLQYFPRLKSFDEYICWQCVSKFREIFTQLDQKSQVSY